MSDSAIFNELVSVLRPIVEDAVKTVVAEVIAEQTSAPPLQRLLSVDEAAERLSIHDSSLRRLIAQGQLKGIKVLGALRIDQRDLDLFIEEKRNEK